MNAVELAPRPPMDEISAVLRSVGHAPRIALVPGWRLDIQPERWRILINGTEDVLTADHQTLLGAGIALEHLVIVLEAHRHRVKVRELPGDDPRAAGSVTVVGNRHPSELMLHLEALSQDPDLRGTQHALSSADLRHLNLTAEAFIAEVMWSSDLQARDELRGQQRLHPAKDPSPYATIVTPSDSPRDWVHAGRALSRLLLKARALGLDAHTELQVLSNRTTRDDLRELWGLRGYPQAQFSLTTRP
jgi:hypothetical protein